MPLPAKAFRGKTAEQSAEIANDKIAKTRKSCDKKVEAVEVAGAAQIAAAKRQCEDAKSASLGQALTQGGTALASDVGMEALFIKSKKAAKAELGISIGGTVLFGMVAAGAAYAGSGYGTSAALGVAQSSASRAARSVMRSQMSA